VTTTNVTARIRALLAEQGVAFREIEHEATRTSEESARVRGEPLEVGAKAIVMRTGEDFSVFVLPAHRKVDSGAIRRHLGLNAMRFATPEELLALTGLVPGSVPPFGQPILPMPLYADPDVGALENRVAFNAGSLTCSFILAATDWRRVAQPKPLAFAR
jgi:prolyl-tRNA editing enzyme YbaK/EbsC (Cys-tRNA(Pro) deacylase)